MMVSSFALVAPFSDVRDQGLTHRGLTRQVELAHVSLPASLPHSFTEFLPVSNRHFPGRACGYGLSYKSQL